MPRAVLGAASWQCGQAQQACKQGDPTRTGTAKVIRWAPLLHRAGLCAPLLSAAQRAQRAPPCHTPSPRPMPGHPTTSALHIVANI